MQGPSVNPRQRPVPVLIFGYGNPSRGDDALGPELLCRISEPGQDRYQKPKAELLTDFQLQVEHALDLKDRQLVLFADASLSASPPYEFAPVHPARDDSYTTHAMSPKALLSVFEQLYREPPPPCYLLSIRGYEFALGSALSRQAQTNLCAGLALVEALLRHPQAECWEERASAHPMATPATPACTTDSFKDS